MRYSPAVCLDCGRVTLAQTPLESARVVASEEPAESTDRAPIVCARCGGEGRLLPGAFYAEGDRPRFELMEQLVHEAVLRPAEGSELALALEQAARLGSASRSEVERALTKVQSLSRLTDSLPESSAELYRFIGLLLTLLSVEVGVRTRRFGSGSRPAVRIEPNRRQRRS